jgi:hypothetical protein
MTYEPGQQVLVRGEILEPPMPAHVGLFVRFVSEDGEGRRVYIRAADVVGPAPATPDEIRQAIADEIKAATEHWDETERGRACRKALIAILDRIARRVGGGGGGGQ